MVVFLFVNFVLLFSMDFVLSNICWRAGNCWLILYSRATSYFNITGIIAVSPWILTQIISKVWANWSCKSLRACCKLAYLLVIIISELLKIWMFKCLRCSPSFIFIVYQHFCNYILAFWWHMRNLLSEACTFLCLKIYLHVSGMFPKII